jgi:hypothetical protein
VQRATAQSKTGIFRDFGVAEAPPGCETAQSKKEAGHGCDVAKGLKTKRSLSYTSVTKYSCFLTLLLPFAQFKNYW